MMRQTMAAAQQQSAGGGAVTPADLTSCVAWWDATDTSSITLDTVVGLESNVKSWVDRVGSIAASRPSGTTRPTSGTRTVNGLNVIDFPGTATGAYLAVAGIDRPQMEADHFVVLMFAQYDNLRKSAFIGAGGADGDFRIFFTDSAGQNVRAKSWPSDDNTLQWNAAAVGENVFTWGVERGVGEFLRVDGVEEATVVWTDTASYSTTASELTIGDMAVSGYQFDGGIGDVIILKSATFPTADIAAAESYLVTKWGL